MRNTLKLVLSVLLVLCMVLPALVACNNTEKPNDETTLAENEDTTVGEDEPKKEAPTYTYKSYTTALGSKWNPHAWETNADDSILSYISSPFCTMQIKDSELGIYQWVFEMATSVEDVTAANQGDLTKYNVTLPEGQTAEQTEAGYVYEIKLNPNAKWQDGTPITADDYIDSMMKLLDPTMKNYRANLYYDGESAVAGGAEYYYAGSTAYIDNSDGENFLYGIDALTKDADGNYVTDNGAKVYINVASASTWLGGNSLADYVGAYGDAYFDVAAYDVLAALADENGLVVLNDETLPSLTAVISNPNWGEGAGYEGHYLKYAKEYPECSYDAVGCYKVDEYTIRYVCKTYLDRNYFLTSCTSTWLVNKELYEAGYDTTGSLKTTDYCTSVETSLSYGPYMIESLQEDKQIVYVQNPYWYGWETDAETGALVSYTPYEVDGEKVQRYKTTKIVVDVMDEAAAKQAFLKGELTDWTPEAEDLVTYATSEQLYKVDETYTMSFFFNCGLDNLKEMDASKGNTNSVVLSNYNFRKAFSLAVDRAEFVTATTGYKPAYAIMNNLYFYDVYNDPTSSYRNSDAAMQAICNLYGVEYGEGTPYATLRDAYNSINGYNLTEAKALMAQACAELVEAGLYTEGAPVHIRIGWAKGALTSSDNKQAELMNKFINAAAEGSGFGTITLEAVGNLPDRYSDVPAGNFAIGYGAWGGAAFYPFRNFQVYCDTEQYAGQINETGCWDPATETHTMTVNGEEVTMTWQDWSRALIGTGPFSTADFETKLAITANLEENFLKKYYRIPLCGTTACSMLSFQVSYYTEDYNIMYGFGGLELLQYNYTDAEWAEYVASQNGALKYE